MKLSKKNITKYMKKNLYIYIYQKELESERALLPSVFAHTRNLSWCWELPVQKQYSTNRQQCKQRQHIIKVIKNTNNEENRQ